LPRTFGPARPTFHTTVAPRFAARGAMARGRLDPRRVQRRISLIMFDPDFETLSALGLTPALASTAAAAAATLMSANETADCTLFRISEVHRETVVVHDGHACRSARPVPKLRRSLADDDSALVVGDWVLGTVDAGAETWIHVRVEPSSAIARRDGDGHRHPIVSNVDTALLVMGLDDDFNPRRMERYLALVHDSEVLPVVVLTKADVLADDPRQLDAQLEALRRRISAEVDVVAVNATQPSARDALAPYLERGRTLVMLGSSGAGKSTLTNTLLGRAVQDTGAVREHDSHGRHTTTARSLHLLPGGACVIDTPGVRTLRPDAGEAAIAGAFADVAALAVHCRFRDCAHRGEPGCAVRAALDEDRLRNYHKLLRESRRDTLTALERQKQIAEWKARGRASRERMRDKRAG
jgi:ribosome biogenesis GTPase